MQAIASDTVTSQVALHARPAPPPQQHFGNAFLEFEKHMDRDSKTHLLEHADRRARLDAALQRHALQLPDAAGLDGSWPLAHHLLTDLVARGACVEPTALDDGAAVVTPEGDKQAGKLFLLRRASSAVGRA